MKRRKNPINLGGSGVLAIVSVTAVGALAAYLYKNRAALKTAFDPTSDKNLAYQGANTILQSITGNKVDSVGTAAANVFPSAAEKAVDAMLKGTGTTPYVAPSMTNSSYYDMGQKAPTVSTSDGSISSWFSSLFKSDAEKAVDASMRGLGEGEVPRRMRYPARYYKR